MPSLYECIFVATTDAQLLCMSKDSTLPWLSAHREPRLPAAGAGDMAAYDPQCLFADPFAGFNGVERFQRNVSNLGGLMQVGSPAFVPPACAAYRHLGPGHKLAGH